MTKHQGHTHQHDHGHGHEHGHRHPHVPPGAGNGRTFGIAILLNLVFVLAEAGYGLQANSLALLADAGHNLSDVLALLLAWGASALSLRGPSAGRTYGLRRSSILAALVNALLLLTAIGAIAWEALHRLTIPQAVDSVIVMSVAAIGIVINGATALLFLSSRRGDLNMRGAFLHMSADAAISLGVVIAGAVTALTGWLWLDPAISLAVAAVIAIGTWDLLRQSVNLALDAVPEHIDPSEVEKFLRAAPGISEVHDLHVWAMSTTEVALTAHLVKPDGSLDDALLAQLSKDLRDRFGIAHATLQMESGNPSYPCELAPGDVV